MNKALNYLRNERHINDAMINKFLLGYCDPEGIVYVGSMNYNTHVLLGPQFNDSVVFPIYDLYNNQVATSVRTFGVNRPKYVNTVYAKTSHLFGLQAAWPTCLATRKAYVVEGNVDTIMLHQYGITNAVGMLGSNLSGTQLCLLSRFVDTVVLVPDGDAAGRKFLNRMRETIPRKYQNLNVTFKICTLPEGYDPDKFVQTYGPEAIFKLEQSLFPTLQERLAAL